MERSNCPNCGAPAVGKACAYCGTPFARPEEVMSLAIGRTVSVSFEHEGRLYEFDMRLENVDVEANADPTVLYADDYMYKRALAQREDALGMDMPDDVMSLAMFAVTYVGRDDG